MEIYLIRHGHCQAANKENYDDAKRTANPELTDQGLYQAAELASKLCDTGFDRIYCSDLKRAQQTAKAINDVLGCGITDDARFREIDMGDLHTKSWREYPDLYAQWSKHEQDISYPNGENGAMVWARCSIALDEILATGFSRVVVVTHGGTIRSIICGILGIAQEKRFYFGCPPENCGVSILKYNEAEEKPYLHTFNAVL